MQKPKLGKIKLLSAKEQVAAVLRKAILSRDLVEGQEITLEGIARLVGVSSMPVREAFQILAADGLIQVRPNKGAVVLEINEQTIREHMKFAPYWKVKPWRKLLVQGPIFHASPRFTMPQRRRWQTIILLNIPT